MNTWAPLWSGIVESSIWDEPDFIVKVFLTMLAIKDSDHVVRKTAYQISKISRKSESEVLEALKVLSSPDSIRIEPQDHEGRRIKAVEDGWLIVNGEKYRTMISREMTRLRNQRSQAAWRERQKANPTEETTNPSRFQKPTHDDLVSAGLSHQEASKFFNFYESKGWKVGKSPMKSWKAAVAGWIARSEPQNSQNNQHSDRLSDAEILRQSQM